MKKLFLLLAVIAVAFLILSPAVSASTTDQSITGNDNTQISMQGNTVNVGHASIGTYAPISSVSSNTEIINYNTMESNGVYDLETGVVEHDRVLVSNQVLVLPIVSYGKNATTFEITSGTPIAVYTIDGTIYETSAMQSSKAKMTYDSIYDHFEHGIVSPVDTVPYFTTKCTITTTSDASFIVLDNRYYPEDSAVQIREGDSGIPISSITPQHPSVYGSNSD